MGTMQFVRRKEAFNGYFSRNGNSMHTHPLYEEVGLRQRSLGTFRGYAPFSSFSMPITRECPRIVLQLESLNTHLVPALYFFSSYNEEVGIRLT